MKNFFALFTLLLLTAAGFAWQSQPSTAGTGRVQAAPGAWEPAWRGTGSVFGLDCPVAGLCYAAGSGGLFLKTTDGGATWRYQSLTPDRDFQDVAFVSANQGLVVGNAGAVYRTADGGETWQSTAIAAAPQLLAASLLPDGRAWAVGGGGAIYYSSDGGATWTAQSSGVAEVLHAVQFLEPALGFAVGEKGTVLRSSDGGASWAPLASTFPAWADVRALFFRSAQEGWIAGQAGLMRRTTDGGATWQEVNTGLETHIYALHFGADVGILGGANGVIATSADGVAWQKRADASANVRDVHAVFAAAAGLSASPASSDLWAAGSVKPGGGGSARAWWIQHSGDGETFSRSAGDFGLFPHLNDVAFPSEDVGYVVGEEASLGKTTDGGETWAWQRLPAPTDVGNPYMLAVTCPTETVCWAAGRYGLVYATSDGGQTWAQQIVPAYGAPVYDLVMLDLNVGHLAGNPVMFRTTNGGATWMTTATVGANANVAVSMINAFAGWTALRNYSYRFTTSGGQTWTRVIDDALAGGTYVGVKTLDSNLDGAVDRVWLVGCAGQLVHEECPLPRSGVIAYSDNGGVSWTYQTLPAGTPPLQSIYMFDALRGWVGGEQGALLYTDTGGAAWETADSGLPAADTLITALDFQGETRGLATARSGYILRFTGPGRTLASYNQPQAIAVDGQAGDWYQGGGFVFDASMAGSVHGPVEWPTPADLSATFYSRWTSQRLYLLAEIRDDVIASGDRLHLAIDGLDDNLWRGADDHLLIIDASGGVTNSLQPGAAIDVAVQAGDGGWVVELGIPASALDRASFSQNDSVGFNLAIEDDDGAGVTHTLVLEGKSVESNPATFAAIRLVGNSVSFQQGVDGYTGADDTHLERWDDQTGSTPRGAATELKIIYNVGQVFANALLKFELENLPANAEVVAAILDVYVTNRRIDAPLQIRAHRLLRPWHEQTATWHQTGVGPAWGTPGALQPGVDYDPTPLDTLTLSSVNIGDHLQWDVTAAVQAWLDGSAPRHGILLLPGGGARFIYAGSSENSSQARRPQLEVEFALQPRPETPTPTPTPTATLTATPTASPTPTTTPTPSPTPAPASVQGLVYEDANSNGVYDAGEPLLPGASLQLTGPGVDLATVTGEDGRYEFSDLSGGAYTLVQTAPPGYGPSTPGTPLQVSLNPGAELTLNFGHRPEPVSMPVYLPLLLH